MNGSTGRFFGGRMGGCSVSKRTHGSQIKERKVLTLGIGFGGSCDGPLSPPLARLPLLLLLSIPSTSMADGSVGRRGGWRGLGA